jgi:hypothetical protein
VSNTCYNEECLTSKASFLDDDELPKYGEKPEEWQPSRKRIKRGLYQSKNGLIINANLSGSANIIRKVSTTLINFSVVSMGVLTRPQRLCFWSAKKTLRNVEKIAAAKPPLRIPVDLSRGAVNKMSWRGTPTTAPTLYLNPQSSAKPPPEAQKKPKNAPTRCLVLAGMGYSFDDSMELAISFSYG